MSMYDVPFSRPRSFDHAESPRSFLARRPALDSDAPASVRPAQPAGLPDQAAPLAPLFAPAAHAPIAQVDPPARGGWSGRLARAASSAGTWLRRGWDRLRSLFSRPSTQRNQRTGGLAAAMREPHPLLAQPQQEGSGAFVEPENQRFGRWVRGDDGRVDEWAGAHSLPYSHAPRPDTPDTPLSWGPAADLGPSPATPDGERGDDVDGDDPYDRPLRRGSFADVDDQRAREQQAQAEAERAEAARQAILNRPTGYEVKGWARHYLDEM